MKLFEHFMLVCNEFNKLNYTGACMLDSIYHMTITFFEIEFWSENIKILSLCKQHSCGCSLNNITICKPLVIFLFYTWH